MGRHDPTNNETMTKTILEFCDIWETDYNCDNWDPEFMTILNIIEVSFQTHTVLQRPKRLNPGRLEGEYSVWLADSRLMTVVFSVSISGTVSPSHWNAPTSMHWCHVLMCSFDDRFPTMLMASPALSPLSLIRMDIHQSLITRPIKLLKQFFLALKNVLENNDKLFVFQY